MRWRFLAILVLALLWACSPVSGAANLTIAASPSEPQIGDPVILSGTVSGISTIAVFLFVTGPGLDPRGTPLDNLNLPTGRGLFTTAPVNMENGTWGYRWDTGLILGTLRPGNYTIHVVDHPIDGLHLTREDYAMTTVRFQPRQSPVTQSPVQPIVPVAAIGVAAIIACLAGGRMRR